MTKKTNYKAPIGFAVASILLFGIGQARAQRTATVSAKYDYVLGENDNVTIRQAKLKALDMARSEAIKNEFGMLVASDFINTEVGANDEFSSYYMAETSTSVKGEWLGDESEPKVEMMLDPNGDLHFIAEVKGKAREIVRAKTDLKWSVQRVAGGRKTDADEFDNKERFYINFKSPADGYLAVYLITGDDDTSCLLPYRSDTSGRFEVKGGEEYALFDKSLNPKADYYRFSTQLPRESNQLVVLYSPHPFTKCTDTSKDPKRPNVLSQKDFAKWLLKMQRADNELVVNKKWVTINGTE
ncbi:MAG: DUF4384 domain-containing protein [Muribaculum sp.]|nr:DUF4384 domain-containing protein [Muribaculum sp.]